MRMRSYCALSMFQNFLIVLVITINQNGINENVLKEKLGFSEDKLSEGMLCGS